MSATLRWFLCALVVLGLFFGTWAARAGLDFWNVPEVGRPIDTEKVEETRRIDERSRCRDRVADDLCAGRVGLLEAAARFRDLNAGTPAGRVVSVHFPGDSEDERCCRHVIAWVHTRQEGESPEQAARLTAALEQELRREGRLRLPR